MFRRLSERLARVRGSTPDPSVPPLSEGGLLESREAITRFLFVQDPPQAVDLCFVLGCPTPTNMDPAIALHARGLAPRILVSGHGPLPQAVPEAQRFRDYAVERGVPASAILLETESTNTRENFVFSAPLIDSQLGWQQVRTVAVVSKPYHARRALMTARRHWPAHVRLVMQPSLHPDDAPAATWWQTESGRAFVLRELVAIGTYAQQGDIGGF